MRRRLALTTATALAALGCLPASAAAPGAAAQLSMPFDTDVGGAYTGLGMDLRYRNAEDPEAKPPPVSKLTLVLPRGTRIDTTAVPACAASDQQIQLLGRDACPPDSQVGAGSLEVYLGLPGDPQTTDVALFNAPGEILEIILFAGTNVTAAIEHLSVEGSTIRAHPAQVPPFGPPQLRAAASHIVWDIPARGGYLTTPPPARPTAGG